MIFRIVGMNLSGGARRYCYILNEGLIAKGYSVRTYIPKSPISDEFSDSDKVPFEYINTKDWFYVAREIFRNRKKIDYVHLHLANVSIRFFLLLKVLHIPYIVTVHAPIYTSSRIKDKIYNKIYALAIRYASGVIFISKFVKQDVCSKLNIINEKFNNKIVYNGSVDPVLGADEKNYSELSENVLNICIVGELTERKGLLDLAKIIELLDRKEVLKSKCISFNVYGEGPLKETLSNLSDGSRTVNIFLKGYQQDLDYIYKNNNIHMILSKDEAFGRVVTEAMAYSVPTVSYNKGAFPELITDRVDGLLATSVEDIANCLIDIYQDPKLLNLLSSNSRDKFTKNFESSIFVENTVGFINKVMKNA